MTRTVSELEQLTKNYAHRTLDLHFQRARRGKRLQSNIARKLVNCSKESDRWDDEGVRFAFGINASQKRYKNVENLKQAIGKRKASQHGKKSQQKLVSGSPT